MRRVLCDAIIARLARFLIELSHYRTLGTSSYLFNSVIPTGILSSRPEQITATAVICGVEGPGVLASPSFEGRVTIESE
jgi:hypothetical protein